MIAEIIATMYPNVTTRFGNSILNLLNIESENKYELELICNKEN